ncbi:MAG TPA: hypothetical protein VLM43_18030, partial [Desulfobacterales bacterium]|nr:hypothetical protein [Desulfobacterales bacterium]
TGLRSRMLMSNLCREMMIYHAHGTGLRNRKTECRDQESGRSSQWTTYRNQGIKEDGRRVVCIILMQVNKDQILGNRESISDGRG